MAAGGAGAGGGAALAAALAAAARERSRAGATATQPHPDAGAGAQGAPSEAEAEAGEALASSTADEAAAAAVGSLETGTLPLVITGARKAVVGADADSAVVQRATDLLVSAIRVLAVEDGSAGAARSSVHAVGALLDEMPPLAAAHAAFKLVRHLPVAGDALDLLPRALSAAVAGGMQTKRDEAMAELLQCEWPENRLAQVTQAVGEIGDLTQEELSKAVAKVRGGLVGLEPSGVPPVVYQLLKLSRRGCRANAVDTLVAHFERAGATGSLNANGTAALRHAQGTCLLHLSFAAKVDAELGKEWLRVLKARALAAPTARLPPALAAALLSLAGVPRLAAPALDMLKGRVLASFAAKRRRKQCRWLKQLVKIPSVADSEVAEGVEGDPSKAVLAAAEHSAYGWDHLAPALLDLGFLLLDSTACRSGGVHVGDDAVALGSKLLMAVYDAHESARSTIVDGLLSGVATPPKKGVVITRDAPGAHASLLSAIAWSRQSTLVPRFAPRLKEALEYFAFLPPGGGAALLTALRPLLRLSTDLRDDALLVLRKATFARDEGARLAAAEGVTSLLLAAVGGSGAERGLAGVNGEYSLGPMLGGFEEGAGGSCSQASELLAGASAASEVVGELVGLLGRCLHQQAVVRAALYESLYRLQLAYPLAQEAACEMLLPHVLRFYASDETVDEPLLRLDDAVRARGGRAELCEPLGRLLRCCARLLALQPPGSQQAQAAGAASLGYQTFLSTPPTPLLTVSHGVTEMASCASGSDFARKLHTALQALFSRISDGKVDIADFGFGPQADWAGERAGQTRERARQLAGALEVALGHFVELTIGYSCAGAGAPAPGGSGSQPSTEEKLADAAERAERVLAMLLELGRCATAHQDVASKKKPGRPKKPAGGCGGGADAGAAHGAVDLGMPLCGSRCLSALARVCVPAQEDTDSLQSLRDALAHHVGDPLFKLWVASSMRRLLEARGEGDMAADADWMAAGGDADAVVLSAPACGMLKAAADSPSPETAAAEGSTPDIAASVAVQAALCVEAALAAAAAAGGDCLARAMAEIGGLTADATLKEAATAAMGVLDKAAAALLEGGAPAAAAACVRACERVASSATTKARAEHADALSEMLSLGAGTGAGRRWRENLSKALIPPALAHSQPGEDLALAARLASAILECMGPIDALDGDEIPEVSTDFQAISHESMLAASVAVLEATDTALQGVEWLLAPLRSASASFARSCGGVDADGQSDLPDGSGETRSALQELEREACERLEAAHGVLLPFFRADPGFMMDAKSQDLLFKVATRVFSCLSQLVLCATAPKGCRQHGPQDCLRTLAEIVSNDMTPDVYKWMQERERAELAQEQELDEDDGGGDADKVERKRKRKHMKAARLADRDMRHVPALIFAIEEYERHLYTLANASNVNLLRGAKRSVARDFMLRIGEGRGVSKRGRSGAQPSARCEEEATVVGDGDDDDDDEEEEEEEGGDDYEEMDEGEEGGEMDEGG